MRQVIILSLLCVSLLSPPLRLAVKVESPDSGRLVKLKWLPNNTKQKVEDTRNESRAPKGYHWMKQKDGSLKVMKHDGKFVPHKGASLTANFAVQKKH